MGKMLPMNDALSVHSRRRAMATALAPPDWAAIHRELKRKHVTLSLRVTYGPYVTQNRKEGPHMRAGRLGRRNSSDAGAAGRVGDVPAIGGDVAVYLCLHRIEVDAGFCSALR